MKRLCVFAGSSLGSRRSHREAARRMGAELARRGIGLVYGASEHGLMATVAEAALEAGGEVIGILAAQDVKRLGTLGGLSGLHVTKDAAEKREVMARMADGFVALPGGLGTVEEFCGVVTLAHLGMHRKPCGVLNVEGYFDPLLALFDKMVSQRFVPVEHGDLVVEAEDPATLLDRIAGRQPGWMEPALAASGS